MSKTKVKKEKRIVAKVSPGPGVFYSQIKCDICKRLIWGSSEKNHREAERDLGQRLKVHQEEH